MAFWRNYFHLTWSTKNRLPLIQPDFEEQLYSYMVKRASELNVFVYAINGIEDHIHVIVAIPPKHSVSEVVKKLKGASSHFINHVIQPEGFFGWQGGYGCLTIGEKYLSFAENYVRAQKQHHEDGTTNGWLERSDKDDEGPVHKNTYPKEGSKYVRDQSGEYDALGELLF